MTQHQAAKALGVDHKTINNDLGKNPQKPGKNPPQSGTRFAL
jgi:hypothetical protein